MMPNTAFEFVEADFQLTTEQNFERAKMLTQWDALDADAQKELFAEAIRQVQVKDRLITRLMRKILVGL